MMMMNMMIMMIMLIMMIFTRLCCTEAVAASSGIDNGFEQTREAGTSLKQNHCLIFDLYLIFDLLWWRLFDGSSPPEVLVDQNTNNEDTNNQNTNNQNTNNQNTNGHFQNTKDFTREAASSLKQNP